MMSAFLGVLDPLPLFTQPISTIITFWTTPLPPLVRDVIYGWPPAGIHTAGSIATFRPRITERRPWEKTSGSPQIGVVLLERTTNFLEKSTFSGQNWHKKGHAFALFNQYFIENYQAVNVDFSTQFSPYYISHVGLIITIFSYKVQKILDILVIQDLKCTQVARNFSLMFVFIPLKKWSFSCPKIYLPY